MDVEPGSATMVNGNSPQFTLSAFAGLAPAKHLLSPTCTTISGLLSLSAKIRCQIWRLVLTPSACEICTRPRDTQSPLFITSGKLMRYPPCHNYNTPKEDKAMRPYLVLVANINRQLHREIREFLYTEEVLLNEGMFGTFDYSNDDEEQWNSDVPQYLRSQGAETHKLVKSMSFSLIQHPSGHYKPRFATLDQMLLTVNWIKEHLPNLETMHLFIYIGHRGGSVDRSLMVLAMRLLERLPGRRIVHAHGKRRWHTQIKGALKDETEAQGIEVVNGCYCPIWEKFMCAEECCAGVNEAFGDYWTKNFADRKRRN